MPNENKDADGALRKFGQRLRQGWAKEHPTPERSIEKVKETVREQWEQQRKTTRGQPSTSSPTKERPREPEEPDVDH